MRVYLFKDYLANINSGGVSDDHLISTVNPIDEIPWCLIRVNGKMARVCMICAQDDSLFIEWVKEPKKLDSIHHESEVTCPNCGNQHSDSWEMSDEDIETCDACGSTYSYSRYIEVTYSSEIIDRNDKVLSLEPLAKQSIN